MRLLSTGFFFFFFLHDIRNVFKMHILNVINCRGYKRKEYKILEFRGFLIEFFCCLVWLVGGFLLVFCLEVAAF